MSTNDIPTPNYMYMYGQNMFPEESAKGWICPKCNKSLAPSVTECPCNKAEMYNGQNPTTVTLLTE